MALPQENNMNSKYLIRSSMPKMERKVDTSRLGEGC